MGLSNLAPSTAPDSTAADLIDNVLATGTKSGYTFVLTAASLSNGVYQTYTATGAPVTVNQTGNRYFFTDQSFVIRQNVGSAATATSTPIG